MPKLMHEAIVHLFRRAPRLLDQLLGPDAPADPEVRTLQVTATEFVDLTFAEYRADVVLLRGPDRRPLRADIVEVQQEPHADKRRVWPLLISGLHARHNCDVYLHVITLDPPSARGCAEPINIGEGCLVVTPRVLDRTRIPRITDLAAARGDPDLATFSAIAHGNQPDGEHVAFAALAAAETLDEERRLVYPDFVLASLPALTRLALDKLMLRNYEFKSDFARHYFSEGKAEGLRDGEAEGRSAGKAEFLLKMLRLKGFRPSKQQRERILACKDEAQLDTWAARVLVAHRLAEVFNPA